MILGIVKAAKIKKPDLTAVNELDLEKALDQLKSNSAKLTNLNLNNHREVTSEVLEDVAKALKSNTNLKHLQLANTQMTDMTAKVLIVFLFHKLCLTLTAMVNLAPLTVKNLLLILKSPNAIIQVRFAIVKDLI